MQTKLYTLVSPEIITVWEVKDLPYTYHAHVSEHNQHCPEDAVLESIDHVSCWRMALTLGVSLYRQRALLYWRHGILGRIHHGSASSLVPKCCCPVLHKVPPGKRDGLLLAHPPVSLVKGQTCISTHQILNPKCEINELNLFTNTVSSSTSVGNLLEICMVTH